ncbi:MAG: helix-turn-helix domain-containing protein, partial [Bdellovibrionota bacterium]
VRELRNSLERTLVMLDGDLIRPSDMGLPEAATVSRRITAEEAQLPPVPVEIRFAVGTTLHEMELEAIRRTLEFTGGDKAKAAEILGINQRTIYRKLPEL